MSTLDTCIANIPCLADVAWNQVTAGVASDVLDESGAGHVVGGRWEHPFYHGGMPAEPQAGRARTLRVSTHGDGIGAERVAEWWQTLNPGEIVWVEGSGEWAFWGELCSRLAKRIGVSATVVDGLTRDTRRVVEIGFPVWSRGYTGRDIEGRGRVVALDAPSKRTGPAPGDIVVADMDGVAVVRWGHRHVFAEALKRRLATEARAREMIDTERPARVILEAECL